MNNQIKISVYILSLILWNFVGNICSDAQTNIKPGEIDGIWDKKGSPYYIEGDINVPINKVLTVSPGVKIVFTGPYVLNIQGTLNANGSEADSIFFTYIDTTGYSNDFNIGWNGIHFDSRPIVWKTIPTQKTQMAQFNNKIDENICLELNVEDYGNDFSGRNEWTLNQSSSLSFCKIEYASNPKKTRPYIFGGGIYIYRYSNLLISNSKFYKNRSFVGGAIYCKEASPVIAKNEFIECTSLSNGGAIAFVHSGPILYDNRFEYNFSGYNGGAIMFYESCPYVLNNLFTSNTAINSGGAFGIERQLDSIMSKGYNISDYTEDINQKLKDSISDMRRIPAEAINNFNGRFINNVICDNSSKFGGAIILYSSAPEFINNTIADNSATEFGGGLYCFFSSPVISNSIIYANNSGRGSQLHFIGSNKLTLNYCDLEQGLSGITKDSICDLVINSSNLITEYPLFANPKERDYTLQKESPCINAGNENMISLKMILKDLDNNNRINDGGIDLGALEFTKFETVKSIKSTNYNESESDNLEDITCNIYPNPSDGNFKCSIINNTQGKLLIQVSNQNGKMTLSKEVSGENIDTWINISNNPPGIYIIKIFSESKLILSEQVVIE